MREREFDFIVVHLFGQWSSGVSSLDALNLHDLDTVSPGPVPGGHVTVTLSHGTGTADVTILSVHVVTS